MKKAKILTKNKMDHPAYTTHFNYINCIFNLLNGATIKYKKYLRKANSLQHLDLKKNLISLTIKSLKDEYKIVKIDKDYSYASTSWLPIKSYYLIFNTLLTIEYIEKLQESCFNYGHKKCVEEFNRKLNECEIEFSNQILNQVFDKSILSFRVITGANLSKRINDEDMYKIAMRKIAKYKEEDWRKQNKINLRLNIDKRKYQNYLDTKFKVSIFDFFYYMRIRSNYRDFAFIEDVSVDETAEYFRKYYYVTAYFTKAFGGMKKQMVNLRLS